MAGTAIIVDNDTEDKSESSYMSPDKKLVAWILETIRPWRDYRDNNYKSSWDEYYRLWRGKWISTDKNRDSERSRLIAPALQQAIEAAVSELEEATFGKGKWFDISDDFMGKVQAAQNPQMEQKIGMLRQMLEEDFNEAGVKDALSEVFLNGALYGTGIGKIVIEEIQKKTFTAAPVEGSQLLEGTADITPSVQVQLVPVDPREFLIDPTAKDIESAMGVAHEMIVPAHTIERKQAMGIYRDEAIGGWEQDIDVSGLGESNANVHNKTKIIEYHGLVPESLLPVDLEDDEELVDLGVEIPIGEDELVEAIVTIANDGVLLKAVPNPMIMQDRGFMAYQHDTVPNRFWGRGVAEKGYNSQKALDAELRGRIDAMALTIHPMMGVDATRIPRGGNLTVQPGRSILTTGDPSSVLKPLTFGQVTPDTFHQSGELERMVQMATGSMDSATPLDTNRRNETASGMSMIASGAIKRSKRTIANIERKFTSPFIHKAAWRYMQFDPDRYTPVADLKFKVSSTLGIMAREFEQAQLSSLLNTVPPDSPAYWMLIRGIYENSSISNREQMIPLIDQMLQQAMNPPPPPPDPMVELTNKELDQKDAQAKDRLRLDLLRVRAELLRARIAANKQDSEEAKLDSETILNLARAEAEEVGSQLNALQAEVDAMKAKSTEETSEPGTI